MAFNPGGVSEPKFGFGAGAVGGGVKTPALGAAKPAAAVAGAAAPGAVGGGAASGPKFGLAAAGGAKAGVPNFGAAAPKFGAAAPAAAAPTAAPSQGAAPGTAAPAAAAGTATTTTPKFAFAGAKPAASVTITPGAAAGTATAPGATTTTTTTTATTAIATTTAGASKFSLGAKPAGIGTAATSTTTAAGTAKAPPAWRPNVDIPSLLKGKTLEEMINEWSSQIDADIFQFTQMAMLVGEWDKKVSSNSKKILDLKQKVDMVESAQSDLNKNLELITAQQAQLSSILSALETSVEKWSLTVDLGPQDAERERGYALADDIDVQLNQMSNKLKEMIDRLNANQERENKDGDHPAFQILQILDSHLNSLAWIDNTSAELSTKLQDLQTQFSRRNAGSSSDASWASRYY